MKTTRTAPKLNWIHNLPEAGTIRDHARKEETILARKAELLAALAACDAELKGLVKHAEAEVASLYSKDEIEAAKDAPAWVDPWKRAS